MIVLILFEQVNKRTNKKEILVSHGVDTDTFTNVSLPPVPHSEIGCFNQNMQEWILKE
jgi:hypothetical protein